MLITDEHIETYAMIDHGNGLTTLYTDSLYRMTQGQLIANAGEIKANRFCYNALLTMCLDREQLKVLAAMDNPLEAVCGAWASAQEVEQEEEFSHIEAAVRVIDVIKGTNLAEIYEAFKNHQPEKLTAEIEKAEDIKDSIRAFIDTLIQEKGNRLIIFIDELDRCKPDYAIRLLERIKHYFDDERITFVFSVNLTQLQWTVKSYYGNSFDATGYLEKFFDLLFTLPPTDYERFLQNRLNLDSDSITGQVCLAIIKQFHFSMRQMERYIRIVKIAGSIDACKSVVGREEKARAFVEEAVIPILIGLQMHDLDMYREFKNGYSSKVMIDILTSPDVLQCGFLIEADEIFRTGETLQRNKNHVEMRDRLQEAYEALFLKTGRVDVGKMTFSNHTREYLYEAESILISDNKFDFE